MFVGFHGDPCSRCPGPVRHRAVHHGMCMPCWLGATEKERRLALLDEREDERDTAHQRFEEYYTAHAAAQLRAELDAYDGRWGT